MKIRTKDLALITIYAALYAALVVGLAPLSYGPLQIRIADAMVASIPIFGMAGVLGHTLGVFVANMFSPLGFIDLLNTIPSFVMAFVVYYVYKRTQNDYTIIATCLTYSAVLGVTVGWMLSLFGAPLLLTIAYVGIGNAIASVAIGWPIFKVLKSIGVYKWFCNCTYAQPPVGNGSSNGEKIWNQENV